MMELDLLQKKRSVLVYIFAIKRVVSFAKMSEEILVIIFRFKQYWTERHASERAEMVKQSKLYWDNQTRYAIGF